MGIALSLLVAVGVAQATAPEPSTEAAPPPAAAPAPAPSSEPPVLETVVTGSRVPERLDASPVAVERLTRRDIQASGAKDLGELLATRPGLEVQRDRAWSSVSMQGLGGEYTLVLVDGERISGRLGGQLDLSRLTTDDIEQVEIVKGPSSVLYGSDAVAGVINVVTRKARRPLGAEATLRYGELHTLDATASAEMRGEKRGARVTGGLRRRDAYALDGARIATAGSSLEGYELGVQGDTALSGRLSLDARAELGQRTQRGVDEASSGAVLDRAMQEERVGVTVQPRLALSPRSTLSFTAHGATHRHRLVFDQRQASALDRVEETRERVGRLQAQLDQTFGVSHRLVVGGEGQLEALASPRLSRPDAHRQRVGLYAQHSWTLPTRRPLTLVPGARFDVDSWFGRVLTPRAALRFDATDGWVLRASYGLAYRAPSFTELFISFENPSVGYLVAGNTSLRPERSRGLQLSSEVRPTSTTLLWLSLFRNDLEDMISVVTLPAEDGQRFGYENVARAFVQGVETGWTQKLPASVELELGYAFTQGRDLTRARPLSGQSPHRVTARVGWRHRPFGLEASVRAAASARRPFFEDTDGDGAAERFLAPAYLSIDTRVAKRLSESFGLFVGGTNLASAGDARFLPIPPRTLFAGVDARL